MNDAHPRNARRKTPLSIAELEAAASRSLRVPMDEHRSSNFDQNSVLGTVSLSSENCLNDFRADFRAGEDYTCGLWNV